MAVSLPLTLAGSFFSAKGLETLHKKQAAHDAEDALLAKFFKQRSAAYHSIASDLSTSLVPEESAKGFSQDEGASVKAAFFRGIQEADTAAQARLYKSVANDLDSKLIDPYERYVDEYANRKSASRKVLQGHLSAFDKGLIELGKVKSSYQQKCIKADQDEDEAQFHDKGVAAELRTPTSNARPRMSPLSIPEHASTSPDQSTHSPRALMTPAEEGDTTPIPSASSSPAPQQTSTLPTSINRKSTVADRLRALTKDTGLEGMMSSSSADSHHQQQKKLEDMEGLIDISGVVNGTKQWSSFFSTAADEIPKRTLKIPLWGVYDNLVTGADLVAYFMENLVALEGDYQRAFEFSRQLAEELYLIRLIGEFGNKFSDENDAFYQFKPEIFHLDNMQAATSQKKEQLEDDLTRLPGSASPRLSASSPDTSEASHSFSEAQSNLIKRSGTILNSISSRFASPSTPASKVQKARQDAQEAEKAYRTTVKRVEILRMTADQQTESHLQYMQKLELDRLHFLKATLKRFHLLCQPVLPQAMAGSTEVELMIQAVQPETDLQAICEMYRATNGYRPQPLVFVDHYGEVLDANFGVDLQRWTDVQLHNNKKFVDIKVPPVLTVVLDHIQQNYASIDRPADRRRIWYLEIPLTATNALRMALNDARRPNEVPTNLLKQSDLPVIAAVVKLFFLELDPPVVPYAAYEQLHVIYPQVAGGSAQTDSKADEAGRAEKLKELFKHLPRVNLLTLDALLQHLQALIEATKDDEHVDPEDRYLAKLGHSMGRCIARPKLDNGLSLNDRAPAYLLADLIRLRDQILPPSIEARTALELERFKPKKKRTRPVDMRISRSSIGSVDSNQAKELLADQLQHKGSPMKPSDSPESSEKALPEIEQSTPAERAQSPPTSLPEIDAPSSVEADRSVEIDRDAIAEQVEASPMAHSEAPPSVDFQTVSPLRFSTSRPSSIKSPPRQEGKPAAAAQPPSPKKQSGERDAPFVPPDEPFVPPTEESSSPTKSSNESFSAPSSPNPVGLNRAPRVKGSRVAQAAQRFSVQSVGSESDSPSSARLSRSYGHRSALSSSSTSGR